MVKRLILHWTAGGHESTAPERTKYHWLLEHDAGAAGDPDDDLVRLVAGVPEDRNARSVRDLPPYHQDPEKGYAAHTSGFNSHSLGLSLCGMRGAWDYRPGPRGVEPGPSPITRLQVRGLIMSCVAILGKHGLDPIPEQLFTHYEAEKLHGVDQYPLGAGIWRWDITWLPHRQDVGKDQVGEWIREQVDRARQGRSIDA